MSPIRHSITLLARCEWHDGRTDFVEMMTIGRKMGILLGLAPFRNLNGCIGGAVVEGWNLAATMPKAPGFDEPPICVDRRHLASSTHAFPGGSLTQIIYRKLTADRKDVGLGKHPECQL